MLSISQQREAQVFFKTTFKIFSRVEILPFISLPPCPFSLTLSVNNFIYFGVSLTMQVETSIFIQRLV